MPVPNPPRLRFFAAAPHTPAASSHAAKRSAAPFSSDANAPAFAQASRSAVQARARSANSQATARHSAIARGSSVSSPAASATLLLRDGLLMFLLFLLLWEWLRPMKQLSEVSDSYSMMPFLIVFGISMGLDWLKVPNLLGWLIKSTALLALIGYLFYTAVFPEWSWLWDFAIQLKEDAIHIIQGDLDRVSPQSRTLLFLIGWMLMLTVAGALMLQRQFALWMVAITLIYLIILQMMFSIDTSLGIIRTVGSGLFLLALLHLPRLERVYGMKPSKTGWPIRWLVISLCISAIAAGSGWLTYQSQRMNVIKPIDGYAWIERWENYIWPNMADQGIASSAVAKSGYGTDDTLLGGPLTPDDSLVFTATTGEASYWRGESKTLYDGKGWSGTDPDWKTFQPDAVYEDTQSGLITQEVQWKGPLTNKQIFYSGALAHIDSVLTKEGAYPSSDIVLWDPTSGKVTLPQITDPISYYKITVHPVRKDVSVLSADRTPYPPTITDTYLQLPVKLPSTIQQLSERITAGLDGPYAKAFAIEQYLRSTYAYSLDKPTLPARNEDFVNHFLFVDKTGYCNQFSTAMVVMLRSVGIPARWVKGYAPGEAVPIEGSTLQTIEVRAKDAHSWVEVYFPSSGWVTFDPTPGFNGQSSQRQEGTVPKTIANQPAAANFLQSGLDAMTAFIQFQWRRIASFGGSAIVLLILLILYKKRSKRQLPSIICKDKAEGRRTYERIRLMDRLWLKIFRLFEAKPLLQTLREYVRSLQVPNEAQKQALIEFTLLYEGLRYDQGEQYLLSKKQIVEVWKTIKNRGTR